MVRRSVPMAAPAPQDSPCRPLRSLQRTSGADKSTSFSTSARRQIDASSALTYRWRNADQRPAVRLGQQETGDARIECERIEAQLAEHDLLVQLFRDERFDLTASDPRNEQKAGERVEKDARPRSKTRPGRAPAGMRATKPPTRERSGGVGRAAGSPPKLLDSTLTAGFSRDRTCDACIAWLPQAVRNGGNAVEKSPSAVLTTHCSKNGRSDRGATSLL